MSQSRVLVFGGGGFIGTHLCNQLLIDGYDVGVFGRSSPPQTNNRVRYIQGDFNDCKAVQDAVRGYDYVFHLIHATNPPCVNADIVGDINRTVIPTLSLLDACSVSGIKKLVFLSSGGTVYGNNGVAASRESDPTFPINAYGAHKLLLENYLRVYASSKNLDYNIIRLSNPYGSFQSIHKGIGLISTVIDSIKTGTPLNIYGGGEIQRDFIYISDAVRAMSEVLMYSGPCKIFNVGIGEGRSIMEVIYLVEEAMNQKVIKKYLPQRQIDVRKSILDISLARSELNWGPKVRLEEGIMRLVGGE